MPPSILSRDELIQHLLAIFRKYGYEGATLSRISKATGLGKASLYHHFPKGKESMAMAVLDYTSVWFSKYVFDVLNQEINPLKRLQKMTRNLSNFYSEGKDSCMIGVLVLSDADDIFHEHIKKSIKTWRLSIEKVLIESGLSKAIAKSRAEDAIIKIQGALVVSRGLDHFSCFKRTMQQLPLELIR